MSRRPVQDPEIGQEHGDEIHPAFGVAVVTRTSGSGRSLFQSDLLHNETISLSVHEATRKRNLSHDWVHRRQEIVSIEMSLAQWGSLVSSMGLGSGVPVTIRRTEHDAFVPEIPHQPRTAESLREVREVTDRMYAEVRAATAVLHEAIHEKKGVRATKEALNALERSVAGAGSNAQFTVDSLVEAGEQVVAQARADIEAHVLEVVRLTGAAPSVEASSFDAPALPGPAPGREGRTDA
ncbi:hypothetical protein [Streptomyces sp. NBC_00439]|uniref:hypothetical protein n=1 Tax=Streptomyces sp. NBC_00439 TaxID=2903650 RepID=UPI00225A5F4C|nr:hypothetical protein [Streptomyces sp. NBC_00439]MCX5103447.1 hypothetical protein [Streptomyces sp. NBC_00439]